MYKIDIYHSPFLYTDRFIEFSFRQSAVRSANLQLFSASTLYPNSQVSPRTHTQSNMLCLLFIYARQIYLSSCRRRWIGLDVEVLNQCQCACSPEFRTAVLQSAVTSATDVYSNFN